MYRQEVPQYGTLVDIVGQVNAEVLDKDHALRTTLMHTDALARLNVERHGAIRLGKASELHTMRRIFAVMGMHAVGYYDLSVAGVPVHSTAFRPVTDAALNVNPFRMFTSLLRLELIEDAQLRHAAEEILAAREIFSSEIFRLLALHEAQGGLAQADAHSFVHEAKDIFRWHEAATVTQDTYTQLQHAHRLIADVVCFKGPHINHLTPRTLDIDAAQLAMSAHGLAVKEVIEGPPRREHPILLRQTSFKALEEEISFLGDSQAGTHTARFGEIEQRGMALTPRGRALYDSLLERVRTLDGAGNGGADYAARLAHTFEDFPDDIATIRKEGLAFFRYSMQDADKIKARLASGALLDMESLIDCGAITATPITYEDFLPVSAAGIFQSNLGGAEQKSYASNASRSQFEQDLGAVVLDEMLLYQQIQQHSIDTVLGVK